MFRGAILIMQTNKIEFTDFTFTKFYRPIIYNIILLAIFKLADILCKNVWLYIVDYQFVLNPFTWAKLIHFREEAISIVNLRTVSLTSNQNGVGPRITALRLRKQLGKQLDGLLRSDVKRPDDTTLIHWQELWTVVDTEIGYLMSPTVQEQRPIDLAAQRKIAKYIQAYTRANQPAFYQGISLASKTLGPVNHKHGLSSDKGFERPSGYFFHRTKCCVDNPGFNTITFRRTI